MLLSSTIRLGYLDQSIVIFLTVLRGPIHKTREDIVNFFVFLRKQGISRAFNLFTRSETNYEIQTLNFANSHDKELVFIPALGWTRWTFIPITDLEIFLSASCLD